MWWNEKYNIKRSDKNENIMYLKKFKGTSIAIDIVLLTIVDGSNGV